MRRLYSLAMSDPSVAEVVAVFLGVITVSIGFFIIVARQAYLAGVYASPITPYGGVKGYVSGFGSPISLPSEAEIRGIAASAFLGNLLQVKLQIWLLSITSLFVTLYPLASRLRSSIIPGSSVESAPPTRLVWAGLLPIVLVSVGFASVLAATSIAAYRAYFGVGLDRGLGLVLADLVLYIVAVAILFYDMVVIIGRPEAGILLGFLGALGIDRAPLSATGVLVLDVLVNVAGILLLALALNRRWLSL